MVRLNYLIFLLICAALGYGNSTSFYNERMIVKLVEKEHTIFNDDRYIRQLIDNTKDDVIVYAYYPTRGAPNGTYEIFLSYYNKNGDAIKQQIGSIEHNEAIVGKWIVNNNGKFWSFNTTGIEDVDIFSVYTKYLEGSGDPEINDIASYSSKYIETWRFVLYFKNKNEKFEGNIEDPNLYDKVTDEFCQSWVYTTCKYKTLGAYCSFDFKNNKYMDSCLNWRRTDIIGEICSRLSDKKRESSIHTFCNNDYLAEDCKCVSRNIRQEFIHEKQKLSNNKTLSQDDCWYEPCRSSNYLKIKDPKIKRC